jgi:fluoride ion exporter CrcB/FEX
VPSREIDSSSRSSILLYSGLIVTLFLILFGVLRGENSINFVVACALGPIGALFRWLLCFFLNNRVLASPENKRFRFGTLLSNLFAVLITGCLYKYGGNSHSTSWILMGICGSLSTVSSWVSDTVSIYTQVSRKWAYFYCTSSVFLCVLIMIPFIN